MVWQPDWLAFLLDPWALTGINHLMCPALLHTTRKPYSDYTACVDLDLWPYLFPSDRIATMLPVLTLTFPVGDFLSYPHFIWPNNAHVDLGLWPYLFPSDCIVSMLPVLFGSWRREVRIVKSLFCSRRLKTLSTMSFLTSIWRRFPEMTEM